MTETNTDRPLRILFGMPCGDTQHSMTALCYGALLATSRSRGVDLIPAQSMGSMGQNNRSDLAQLARSGGYDALLLVDPDMTFPAEALLGLLAHGDLDVVGATYAQCCEGGPTHGFEIEGPPSRINVSRGGPPREVSSIPCGFMLIRRRVLDAIVALGDEPFFRFPWDRGAHNSVSEDYDFCRRVREIGFKVHVDPELSLAMGHIGIKIYTIPRAVESE